MTFDPATSPLAAFLPLLEGSLDPIGIVDADGRYVWVNEAGARFFGYERHEVVGTHFRDHLREDEAPGQTMHRAQTGSPAAVVRRVRRKDGSVAVVRTELIPATDGLVLIHATDLTVLYETLDRVSESEGVLARAQDIGHTGSWVLRLPERTVRWFGPMGDLLGMEPGSFIAAREVADALVHPDDSAIPGRLVTQALSEGSADGEFRTRHPERGLRWLRMYAHAIRD